MSRELCHLSSAPQEETPSPLLPAPRLGLDKHRGQTVLQIENNCPTGGAGQKPGILWGHLSAGLTQPLRSP